MTVEGTVIPAEVIEAAYRMMRKRPHTTFYGAQRDLIIAGVEEGPAYRAADRLLQKLRRDGLVTFQKNRWEWVN